jgi:hypothetical protein
MLNDLVASESMSDKPVQQQPVPIARLYRYLMLVIILTLLVLLIYWYCQNFLIYPGLVNGKQRLLTISQETTRVTGPLDELGFIDYAEALNEIMNSTLPAEQNAFVLYLEALPATGQADPIVLKQVCEKLQIPIPTLQPYGYDFESYLMHQYPQPPTANQLERVEHEKWTTSLLNEIKKPWKAAEHPDAKAWLDLVSPGLALIKAGTQRPGYYCPYLSPADLNERSAAGLILPFTSQYRSIAVALNGRIMLAIGEGDYRAAKDDLLVMNRLTRDAGQSITLVEQYVCAALDSCTFVGEIEFANRCPDAELLRTYQTDLQELPTLPELIHIIDVAERLAALNLSQLLTRYSLGLEMPEVIQDIQLPVLVSVGNQLMTAYVDPNLIGKIINRHFDQIIAQLKLPRDQKLKGLNTLDLQLDVEFQRVGSAVSLTQSILSPQCRSKNMAIIILSNFIPDIPMSVKMKDRYDTRRHMVDLVLSLNRYRLEHGSYPDALDNLVPQYQATIPLDLFTDLPFHYVSNGKEYELFSVGEDGKVDAHHNMYRDGYSRFEDDIYASNKAEQ